MPRVACALLLLSAALLSNSAIAAGTRSRLWTDIPATTTTTVLRGQATLPAEATNAGLLPPPALMSGSSMPGGFRRGGPGAETTPSGTTIFRGAGTATPAPSPEGFDLTGAGR